MMVAVTVRVSISSTVKVSIKIKVHYCLRIHDIVTTCLVDSFDSFCDLQSEFGFDVWLGFEGFWHPPCAVRRLVVGITPTSLCS